MIVSGCDLNEKDLVQLVNDSDDEIHLERSVLAPLQDEPMKIIRSYLRALPRGRKTPFKRVLTPFCASELQFKQAIFVAHAAGIYLEGGWLTYEIACAHAALLYPSQCESWLVDVVGRAWRVGFPIEELFPNIAQIISELDHCLPPPLPKLDPLPEGGTCPGLISLQKTLVLLHDRCRNGEKVEHIKSLQKYVNCVEQVVGGKDTDLRRRAKVFPCEVQTHELHQNMSGPYFGFCTDKIFKKFTKELADIFSDSKGHIEVVTPSLTTKLEEVDSEMKEVNLNILLKNLDKIDTLYWDLLAPFLPEMTEILKKLAPIVEKIECEHVELWKKVSSHDLNAAESVVFTRNAQWSSTQADGKDVALLYHTAWSMVPTLYMFTHQLMVLFNIDPKVQIKVQGLRGRLDKLCKLDPEAYAQRDFTCVQDVLLCICTFESLPYLAAVAEFVDENLGAYSTHDRRMDTMKRLGLPPEVQDLDIRLVVGKNRFADRLTGEVRCMKLMFSMHDFIAQVRFEYSVCRNVRSKNGKTTYNWVKLFKSVSVVYIGESTSEDDDLSGRIVTRRGFGGERDLEGNLYIGQWVNNERHGWGTLWEAHGNIYQGEFAEGVRHGHGTIWQTNGSVVEGEFDGKGLLRGTSTTWFASGWVEVMDHHVQLRAEFNPNRTKATLQLLPMDKLDEKDPKSRATSFKEGQQPDGVLGVSTTIWNVESSKMSTEAKDELKAKVREGLAESAQVDEDAIATVTLSEDASTWTRILAKFRKDVGISITELEERLNKDAIDLTKLRKKIADHFELEECFLDDEEVVVTEFEVSLQQGEKKYGSRASICKETAEDEEECAQLGIMRGGPKKVVTIEDACDVQDIDHSPPTKPPVVVKIQIPRKLQHVIKQTQKTGEPGFVTMDLNVEEALTEFEEQFQIHCVADNWSPFDD